MAEGKEKKITGLAEEPKELVTELIDKVSSTISGKDSDFSLDLDNVGFDVGGRRVSLTGKLGIGFKALKEEEEE